MSRRPDPARLRQARRAALRNRLISDGLLPEQVNRWISSWAERAGEPDSAAEFDAAYEWIVSELAEQAPDAVAQAVTTLAARGPGTG